MLVDPPHRQVPTVANRNLETGIAEHAYYTTAGSRLVFIVVVVRWQKNNEKVGKEAREVKRKSKQIVAEGLKRNEKDRRGWKRRRGEGDR